MPERRLAFIYAAFTITLCIAFASPARSQTVADPVTAQLQQLTAAIAAMRVELADARRASSELQRQVDAMRAEVESLRHGGSADAVARAAQDQELLAAKIEDQEQTKVESGSKYHARLSGMALFNVGTSIGAVDSLDLPAVATSRIAGDSGGAFFAGVRQSFLNLAVFGPSVAGAHTSGSVSFDFFGGFPAATDGLASAHGRLRTATLAFDWQNSSIFVGQDVPFFSPQSPSSLSSVAYPALASAGNLWAWTPQIRAEHRFSFGSQSQFVLQAGVLDPLTGEQPASEYVRLPTAGERSRQPAQAARVAWQQTGDRAAVIGAGAYHSSQNWGYDRRVDGWVATGDWHLPIGAHAVMSGEIYRGRAIAGLGGGAAPSVLFSGMSAYPASVVMPLSSRGGWAQFNVTPTPRLDVNFAYGLDRAFRPGISALAGANGAIVTENASGFVNAVYRARSNVVFSLEVRHLWTTRLDSSVQRATHISFISGIIF